MNRAKVSIELKKILECLKGNRSYEMQKGYMEKLIAKVETDSKSDFEKFIRKFKEPDSMPFHMDWPDKCSDMYFQLKDDLKNNTGEER